MVIMPGCSCCGCVKYSPPESIEVEIAKGSKTKLTMVGQAPYGGPATSLVVGLPDSMFGSFSLSYVGAGPSAPYAYEYRSTVPQIRNSAFYNSYVFPDDKEFGVRAQIHTEPNNIMRVLIEAFGTLRFLRSYDEPVLSAGAIDPADWYTQAPGVNGGIFANDQNYGPLNYHTFYGSVLDSCNAGAYSAAAGASATGQQGATAYFSAGCVLPATLGFTLSKGGPDMFAATVSSHTFDSVDGFGNHYGTITFSIASARLVYASETVDLFAQPGFASC